MLSSYDNGEDVGQRFDDAEVGFGLVEEGFVGGEGDGGGGAGDGEVDYGVRRGSGR